MTTTTAPVAPAPSYEFDAEVQTEILSCLMFDSDFSRRTEGLIKPAYFENDIERVYVDIALAHFAKYQESPSGSVWVELVKEAFATGRFRSDQKKDAVTKLSECSKLVVRSRAWLMDSIATFAKQQAVIQGILDASRAVFKTTDPERFEKAEKVMSGAFSVALHVEDEDYDYFAKIEERTAERKEVLAGGRPKTGVTTGVEELDSLLTRHQGWGRQELSAIIAGSKASKSFFLYFAAAQAVKAGKNALIVTLENSKAVVSSRLDAFFSGVGLSEEFKTPFAMETGVKAAAKAVGKGTLRIREAPAYSFRPGDLRRMLDEYKTKGVTFDLIVIDYTDIMAPDHRTDNTIENSKSVLICVRQIAREENAALLTAFQTNREGHKSATVKAEHVAEDFNRVRTADLVLGFNRTEEEKSESKLRITFVAARNSPDGFVLFCRQDLDKGKAIAEVESVE
jgi:replicative DNA helicase